MHRHRIMQRTMAKTARNSSFPPRNSASLPRNSSTWKLGCSSPSSSSSSSPSSSSSLLFRKRKMTSVVLFVLLLCDCVVVKTVSATTDANNNAVAGETAADSNSEPGGAEPTTNSPQCVLKGRVYTERLWYGYLIDKAFHRDYAKIQYTISYPVKECCVNLLIYYDDQIKQLSQDMSCEEREKVLPANNNQVIPLHTLNHTVGCRVWNETEEPYYVCVGERIFRSSGPRTWYFALSRCNAKVPLTLNYSFNVTGYYGECEEDPLVKTYIPPSPKEDNNMYLSLALGVVAAVAVIAAIVFFALWFIARRRAANSKGSSVTSSQATMTQDDIFYVNPSLSDRGEHQEYGQSQASSENYYEVIPERRSYESINPHMLAAGGGPGAPGSHHPLLHPHPHFSQHLHPHAHGTHPRQAHFHPGPHATQVKESAFHRPHPAGLGYPMFEDYPPPPYQPPRLLGGPKHHTLHHPTPHHHHGLSLPGPRPRPPILSPTHATSISFPTMISTAPPAPSSPLTAILNNNSSSGNNNSGGNSNNNMMSGISSNSPISMNTSTNVVTLGETNA